MRAAGSVVVATLEAVRGAVRPGVATAELDRLAEEMILSHGGVPAFKGYAPRGMRAYPASICTSINEEIVHGIPGPRRLVEGDILSVDCGVALDGYHGDAAITVAVGEVDSASRRLMEVTERSLGAAIQRCRVGAHLSDIGNAVQKVVEAEGFAVVREYVGHGIGVAMHEEPAVPNYGPAGRGVKLQPGMVFAIEPMVNAGTWMTKVLDDGWTVATEDGSRSAHFEHTVAVTEEGPRVLTAPAEGDAGHGGGR